MEGQNVAFNEYEYLGGMEEEPAEEGHLGSGRVQGELVDQQDIEVNNKDKDYCLVKEIGQGTFGRVFQAYHIGSNETFAIKKVYLDPNCINREFSILQVLQHPNVIAMHDSFFTKGETNPSEVYLNIVMDFIPTTLNKVLRYYHKMGKVFPSMLAKLLIYQLLRSLAYLKGLTILHRDIKPANVLIDVADYRLVLCDFGCAKQFSPKEESVAYICSRYYRCPELILGCKHYGCEVDTWAVGCVAAEMFLGEPLFQGSTNKEQFLRIVHVLGAPQKSDLQDMSYQHEISLPNFSPITLKKKLGQVAEPLAIDLMSKLLAYSPKTRITPFQALTHPYFDELRKHRLRINDRPVVDLFNFTPEEIGEDAKLLGKLVPDWYKPTTNN